MKTQSHERRVKPSDSRFFSSFFSGVPSDIQVTRQPDFCSPSEVQATTYLLMAVQA